MADGQRPFTAFRQRRTFVNLPGSQHAHWCGGRPASSAFTHWLDSALASRMSTTNRRTPTPNVCRAYVRRMFRERQLKAAKTITRDAIRLDLRLTHGRRSTTSPALAVNPLRVLRERRVSSQVGPRLTPVRAESASVRRWREHAARCSRQPSAGQAGDAEHGIEFRTQAFELTKLAVRMIRVDSYRVCVFQNTG